MWARQDGTCLAPNSTSKTRRGIVAVCKDLVLSNSGLNIIEGHEVPVHDAVHLSLRIKSAKSLMTLYTRNVCSKLKSWTTRDLTCHGCRQLMPEWAIGSLIRRRCWRCSFVMDTRVSFGNSDARFSQGILDSSIRLTIDKIQS